MDDRIHTLLRQQPSGVNPVAFVLAVSEANFEPLIDPAS
jgi:hypothetical protein